MSKFSEKMQEAQDIARATALLEQLNTRLSVGGRNWREKQTQDWCALRQIANNQIARGELLDKPTMNGNVNGKVPLTPSESAIINAETQDLDQ